MPRLIGTDPYSIYDPNALPPNPSALNDEFQDASTTSPRGWTAVGAGILSSSIRNHQMVIETPPDSSDAIRAGIERDVPLPSGSFTVITHCTNLAISNWNMAGMYVRSVASGKILASILYTNSNHYADMYVGWRRYTSFTGYVTGAGKYIAQQGVYMRISYDGINITHSFSVEGGEWIDIITEPIGTWFTDGHLPSAVGFFLSPINGSVRGKGVFKFLRHFPYANADIGQTINL